MALTFQHTDRTTFIRIAYVVLIWFLLVLLGSVLGTFAQSPLVFYLTVGGPIVLYMAGYLLSAVFRRFVRSLVGDPWVITALQTYRVLGISMAIQALRNALPMVFGLPSGFGDLFIGVTALLAAASWSAGTRAGKAALVTQSGPVTMAPMRIFPLSLVPGFGVPLAFILHVTGLAQLWSLSGQKKGSPSRQAALV